MPIVISNIWQCAQNEIKTNYNLKCIKSELQDNNTSFPALVLQKFLLAKVDNLWIVS